jgi:hypothetical protein
VRDARAERAARREHARRLCHRRRHVGDIHQHVVGDDKRVGRVGEWQRLGAPEDVLAAGVELRGRAEQGNASR